MIKKGHIRFVWLLTLIGLYRMDLMAQADINIMAGIETWSLKDELETFDRSRHPGQLIGINILVEKGRGVFMPGFHYHRFTAGHEPRSFEFSFRNPRHLHYFTIPLLFGYKLTDESLVDVTLMAGPEVQFFYQVDPNDAGLDDDMMYGVSTSFSAGIHSEWFSIFTLECRYHHGLQPLIRTRGDSKLRGISLGLGIQL